MSALEPQRAAPRLVILAAGASRRLGECKALVDIAGSTPLERLLHAATGLGDALPIVVTGADHAAITARGPYQAEILHNPDWTLGATSGVRRAHAACLDRDLCLAPVDVPLVPRRVFVALFEAWADAGAPERGWLAPRYAPADSQVRSEETSARRFGHPVIAGRRLLDLIDTSATLQDLRARADRWLSVAVSDPEILDDLDTREDLTRLRARAQHRSTR
ncbi:MAG: NTP transferase domain-containing protein [Planctomycetota bacterium]